MIRVKGHDRPDLLHILTGALGQLELTITSASARTTQHGSEGSFIFKVVSQDKKVRSAAAEETNCCACDRLLPYVPEPVCQLRAELILQACVS